MGDWTGTVPTFAAGAKLRGVDQQTLADILTALTAVPSAWTPTLTNLTQGSGTVTAKYRRIGKGIDWYFRFVYGAGSAVGTDPTFTLPATPATFYPVNEGFGSFPGEAHIVDASGAARAGNIIHPTSTTAGVNFFNATPTLTQITATVPWTWTTSDSITAWGFYWTD